jgi:subfamily B ATP-binding cassette protein MsbA
MRTFLRILTYARPLGWHIPQYLVLIILTTIFSVINFTVVIPLLRVLFETTDEALVSQAPTFSFSIAYFKNLFYYQLSSLMEVRGKVYALYFICGIAVGSVFLANAFRYGSQLILAKVQINVIRNLRNALFHNVIHLDLGYFTTHKKGDILSRITGDATEIEQTIASTLRALIREPLLILGYFIALFSLSVELTLYTLILIPISGAIISTISKKLKRSAQDSQETLGAIHNTLDESLNGIRVLKAFGAGDWVVRKFGRQIDQFARLNFKIAARVNLASPTSEFLGVSVLTMILLIGGSQILEQDAGIDAAQFIGFLLIFAQVLNPAKAISAAFGTWQRGIAAGTRIFDLMDQKPNVVEDQHATTISSFNEQIQFDQLSFAYDQTPVIRDVSFEIKKGEVIALVGSSGGGKSTITDLLLRFYDPDKGQILFDGKPLHSLDAHSLRALIGVVPQETILFNDTVANNIAIGMPGATMDSIKQAAKTAQADEFISRLENGYETTIGERGNKLSGGQKQRISIARAILKNPPILIMDEATSSLDSASEKAVRQAIGNLMKDRTAIIVAHRFSTIQHANKILVIADGKIIEQGTHDTLIRKEGVYKKFSDMQTF